jgi:hypothetical protein
VRSLLGGFTLIVMAITAPIMAAEKVELSIDASKTGGKIDRNIFGQFAEHLGHGIYDGVWVGSDSTILNTRGIRNNVVATPASGMLALSPSAKRNSSGLARSPPCSLVFRTRIATIFLPGFSRPSGMK